MSKSVNGIHETSEQPGHQLPRSDEIRSQLRKILESPAFHGSKRGRQFLEYVCEQSLSGEAGTLKERSIAIDVFGREPMSHLGEDTIVRVGARELRRRLAQYYGTPEGIAAEIRIDLPLGSYAPEFRYAASLQAASPALLPQEEEHPVGDPLYTEHAPSLQRRPRRSRFLSGMATIAILGPVIYLLIRPIAPRSDAAELQKFWQPVLETSEPLLIAVAHPLVYHPSARALKLSEQGQLPLEVPAQRPLQVPPKLLSGNDMVPVINQYVGFGDMIAATEVSAMLARKSKPVRLRMASGVEFADLRGTQTLLIGAITNRWTMQLQTSWRFRFVWTPGTRTTIVDTQAPPGTAETEWAIPAKDDGSAPEDYILLCRVRNSFTGGWLILAAGLKQFGTEAAGRLLADPVQLGVILRKLPAGWEDRNLQYVLRAKVINNSAALPEVVATHVW